MTTLLQMVNNIAVEVGLERTGAVVSGATAYRQIARFIVRTGKKLITSHNWRAMKVTGTFQGDDETTLFDLPENFDRLMPGLVIWEYGRPFYPLVQVSDQDMLMIRSVPWRRPWPVWRLVGEQIEFWPAPRLGGIFNFGYQTNQFIQAADGVTLRDDFAADNDTVLLPSDILELGAIWRFKSAKGMEYAEAFREFELERAKAEMGDGGAPTIRLSGAPMRRGWSSRNAYTVNT